jgi:hypothetical protein
MIVNEDNESKHENQGENNPENKSENKSENICSICKEDILKSESKSETECKHVFHSKCLFTWLSKGSNKNCPNCRRPMVERTSPPPLTNIERTLVRMANIPTLEPEHQHFYSHTLETSELKHSEREILNNQRLQEEYPCCRLENFPNGGSPTCVISSLKCCTKDTGCLFFTIFPFGCHYKRHICFPCGEAFSNNRGVSVYTPCYCIQCGRNPGFYNINTHTLPLCCCVIDNRCRCFCYICYKSTIRGVQRRENCFPRNRESDRNRGPERQIIFH